MPERFSKPHLNVNRFSESEDYRYPSKAPVRFRRQERDRNTHGRRIREDLAEIISGIGLADFGNDDLKALHDPLIDKRK